MVLNVVAIGKGDTVSGIHVGTNTSLGTRITTVSGRGSSLACI